MEEMYCAYLVTREGFSRMMPLSRRLIQSREIRVPKIPELKLAAVPESRELPPFNSQIDNRFHYEYIDEFGRYVFVEK